MSLYQKYRPASFADVAGAKNADTIKTLKATLDVADPPHAYLLAGPSGCLRGDTPIFDPVEGMVRSVAERYRIGLPFYVWSWMGDGRFVVAQALPPVRYPSTRLYRVKTARSVVCVSVEHRFLSEDGEYLSLKELAGLGFGNVPLLSIEASDLGVLLQGESRYSEIEVGSPVDCQTYLYSCDTPPPLEGAGGQSSRSVSVSSATDRIIEIEDIGSAPYFDFHVPVWNNYWAAGLVHHNCGKTTIGRLIAAELGVAEIDYNEIDSADFRGIDSIRDIRRNSGYKGTGGGRRLWLIDECFASGTLVSMPQGDRPIEHVVPGDVVYSLVGPSKVLNTFRNVVLLHRIVRLGLSTGQTLYTTLEHLFMTSDGRWIEAGTLSVGDLLLPVGRCIVGSEDYAEMYSGRDYLSDVRERLRPEEEEAAVLFGTMCANFVPEDETAEGLSDASVPGVRERDELPRRFQEIRSRDVWQGVWEYPSGAQTDGARSIRGYPQEAVRGPYEGPRFEYGARSSFAQSIVGSDEDEQSVHAARGRSEGVSDEADKWDDRRFPVGEQGWQWEAYCAADTSGDHVGMEDGGCDTDRTRSGGRRVPVQLQGRYCELGIEDSDRSRRGFSQFEAHKDARREEGTEACVVRVESIEVYEPGCNDGSFLGIIRDQERRRGYVIFHDLEVEDDPSYFVGGVAVHNCHKLTKDAQEAFLKGLEDPPAHAYYVLCTTEPEKLLPTLRGRCSAFLVHLLTEPEMLKLLGRIAAREGAQIPRSSIQKIVEVSGGHCRDAIQMLQQMIADPDATLASFQSSEAKTIDLCRALIGAKGWKEVASILAELKDEDVERTRRAVLGYCTVILLKGANERAMVVLDQFVSNFYDSGFPGLVHASYCVVNGDNGGA